jgi:hypothetical protein
MTFIEQRINDIEVKFSNNLKNILVEYMTDETFKAILYLIDGNTLRITERWKNYKLIRYSYFWLDEYSNLKIGWDNALHHNKLDNFPHHKHVSAKENIEPSYKSSLDDIFEIITKFIRNPESNK